MRLWPRSLLWRTFILLAALVLATTVAWFEIFRAYELEPRARQISQNFISIGSSSTVRHSRLRGNTVMHFCRQE